MNVFASLEDVLSPVGEPKAPSVGLLVEDWDENLKGATEQIVKLGRSVQIIPLSSGVESSLEAFEIDNSTGSGEPTEMDMGTHVTPQVLFYYKGIPKDANEGIPVLTVEAGRVKVSHEGRVKELAEALGLLEEDDNDPGDHEYR